MEKDKEEGIPVLRTTSNACIPIHTHAPSPVLLAFSSFLSKHQCHNCRPSALPLSESRRAPAHDFPLTYQLGVKFTAVEGEEDIEVDACMVL